MPRNVVRKSWSEVWKNAPDSTYDATPLDRGTIAKQFAKEAAQEMQTGGIDANTAQERLHRIQRLK